MSNRPVYLDFGQSTCNTRTGDRILYCGVAMSCQHVSTNCLSPYPGQWWKSMRMQEATLITIGCLKSCCKKRRQIIGIGRMMGLHISTCQVTMSRGKSSKLAPSRQNGLENWPPYQHIPDHNVIPWR